MSRTAFVGNLSFSATEEELKELFSTAGPVVKARIGMDRETGKSRGFAFVEFASDEDCAAAIQRLNGHEMGGRRLRVNDADDKPPPRPASAPGGFRPGGFAPRSSDGGGFAPRAFPQDTFPPQAFDRRDDFDGRGGGGNDFGGGGGGGGGGGDPRRKSNVKGSRRGIRGRKRSLWG